MSDALHYIGLFHIHCGIEPLPARPNESPIAPNFKTLPRRLGTALGGFRVHTLSSLKNLDHNGDVSLKSTHVQETLWSQEHALHQPQPPTKKGQRWIKLAKDGRAFFHAALTHTLPKAGSTDCKSVRIDVSLFTRFKALRTCFCHHG